MSQKLSRRRLLVSSLRYGLGLLLPLTGLIRRGFAATDPRPEFSATDVEQVLLFYFGMVDAADDASIEIEAPLTTTANTLVPFKVRARGVERLVVVCDANPQPLVLAMDRINSPVAIASGRARISRSGQLFCYALKNGSLSRASRRISIGGHWQENLV